MDFWQYIFGWLLVVVNSLCLLRLGVLPMIFFARNYKLYGKIFWVSCFVSVVFLGSEVMLVRMMLHIGLK